MPADLRPLATARRARQPLRRLLRSAAALLTVGFAVTWVEVRPASATYATGGTGIYPTSWPMTLEER